MAITPEKTEEIVERIVEAVHPHRIYLFGSRAKGTETEDSDIDLLVIADMEGPPHKRSVVIHRLFPRRNFSMDVFVLKPEEFEHEKMLVNSIGSIVSKEGKILYER
ncbi:nucleotidyltransferase domain-containing protein [Candidatus Poribacteria bacterium]